MSGLVCIQGDWSEVVWRWFGVVWWWFGANMEGHVIKMLFIFSSIIDTITKTYSEC